MRRSHIVVAVLCASAMFAVGLAAVGINAGEQKKSIRVIYSNDLIGYTEPCGCGGHYEGGLPRRATEMSILVKENPNIVVVDSGNLSNTPEKLDVITTVMSQLNYDAIGMGASDIRLGKDFLNETAAKKLVVLDASPAAKETTKPYVIKVVDGVKVGIISFGFVPEKQDQLALRKSLYGTYKKARDESDILIVLDQSDTINKEWIERNGPRFGAPDLVVGGVQKMGMTQPDVVGKTYICPTSYQGKYLGVADVEFVKGHDAKIDVRKIFLEKAIPEDEAVLKMVKGEREHAVKTSSRQLVAPKAGKNIIASGSSAGDGDKKPYYPPQLCRTCHLKEYEDWAKTGHANAIKTLVDAKRTVPECLTCHTEMFRRLGQWASSADGIGGVECASCHANSLPHGLERTNVKQKTKVNPALCLDCHTKDKSPEYDEDLYFPMTTHGASDD
ncbi:MAG: multiheme c-type cytochrome [Armatimonadota bacterium]|nr:hypothetical protein [bacterium]